MQVNVFITRQDGALKNKLLILLASPDAAVPPAFGESWRYYATADSSDALFGTHDASVEAELGARGFAIVEAGRQIVDKMIASRLHGCSEPRGE